MSWRTVVISHRCKLDLKMGYMVIRAEDTKRVFLDEISVLIIENTAVSLTGCLLEALCEKKIRVIFCDGKRNPMADLAPIYGSHDCSRKIKEQIKWSSYMKEAVWTEIVTEKIKNQSRFLMEIKKTDACSLLTVYLSQIQFNDETNREGHAAKVYFNALFGNTFTRSCENTVNQALNYGYSILLSAFNREITANGYLTQLGLCHDNIYNKYNLGSDIMEPFRVIVDRHVYFSDYAEFGTVEKHDILTILNRYVTINSASHTVLNAIKIYTKSIFDALENGDISEISFIEL